jgi:F-type H+-transporting ATPase subunit delta
MISTYLGLRETYAQALFELACDNHVADAVKDDIELLAEIINKEEDFLRFLGSPYFARPYKEQLVSGVLSGKITDLTMNFLLVLIGHSRTALLPRIVSRYGQLWDANNGYFPVKVTVAHPLDEAQRQELQLSIEAAVGGLARLELVVKPDVIGGVVVRCGDRLIDNTVRGRLQTAVKTIMGQLKSQTKQRTADSGQVSDR